MEHTHGFKGCFIFSKDTLFYVPGDGGEAWANNLPKLNGETTPLIEPLDKTKNSNKYAQNHTQPINFFFMQQL